MHGPLRRPEQRNTICPDNSSIPLSFPEARGQAVYAENLLDGRYIHRERKDFYGIVKPESLAAWLSDKPIRSEVAEAVLEAAVQDLAPELEGEEEMEH